MKKLLTAILACLVFFTVDSAGGNIVQEEKIVEAKPSKSKSRSRRSNSKGSGTPVNWEVFVPGAVVGGVGAFALNRFTKKKGAKVEL